MDFLGVGPLELLVVLIIALIVVGPERLPEIAQTIGKTLRDLRAMSQGFASEWQQELNSVSKIDVGQKQLTKELARPFKEAQDEVQQALSAPLTSPSDAMAEPAPQKEPSPEQPDTPPHDADYDNT